MHKPRVATDIRMPPTQTDEGLRAAQEIRERFPGTGVLVLSQYVEPGYAMELLAENAEGVGYLLMTVSTWTSSPLRCAVLGEGGSALDPSVVSQLVGRRYARIRSTSSPPASARCSTDGRGPLEPGDLERLHHAARRGRST